MTDTLFQLCARFLEWLGKATSLTYIEISVIFNLWIQGGLLVITSALPLWIAVNKYTSGKAMLPALVWAAISFLMHCLGFVWIIAHYGTNMTRAFYLCVDDLIRLSHVLHTTYNAVNILIFVIGWLALFSGNVYFAWKLN